jgi:6-phosphogluconate dehydrogenase
MLPPRLSGKPHEEDFTMQLGMIGLGRMGGNMVRRLMRSGHECVGTAQNPATIRALEEEGMVGAGSPADLVEKLARPRTIWLMIPAAAVDDALATLVPLLDQDDTVIDGGNSHYHDDIRRAGDLASKGIHYVDVGVSGGVWGLERGYCLMIGGEIEAVRHLEPLFVALAPGIGAAPRTPGREEVVGTAERGYLHCGPAGAGHYVKMIHNGIEYGIMAAYAEGLNILHRAGVGKQQRLADAETAPLRHPEHYLYDFDLADITEVWRRGSVIASWLLDLTARALLESSALHEYAGRVSDSGEGRWALMAAIEQSVPAPVLSAALYARFESRGEAEFANRVLSAMRHQFGGHLERHSAAPQG